MGPPDVVAVEHYLEALPEERRALVAAVRDVVNTNLPTGYQEGIQYRMIGWSVPHSLYPAGYQTDPRQPLPYAALGSQKQSVSLHLMGLYLGGDESPDARWFREAWVATGLRLDMGKGCVRFKKLDAVPLDVIGEAVRRFPVDAYIALYQAALATRRQKR